MVYYEMNMILEVASVLNTTTAYALYTSICMPSLSIWNKIFIQNKILCIAIHTLLFNIAYCTIITHGIEISPTTLNRLIQSTLASSGNKQIMGYNVQTKGRDIIA